MRVLVTFGSKLGGTEGIARALADGLAAEGLDVVVAPAREARTVVGFDAVIVGGALYGNRWPASVRRFVQRNVAGLRRVPTWFFSSGPLDDSADREVIPAPKEVAVLAERVGAKGHVTFGGRLEPDAKGFPASAMAKTASGDFRSFDRIGAWAKELARALPSAAPGRPVDHPGRSVARLVAHGALGWALCAATMALLLTIASPGVAQTLHAILVPLFFVAVAWHYFRARGARDPLPTAVSFTAIVAVLDLVVAAVVLRSLEMFTSFAGTWLPLALIFFTTWATGGLMATMPWPVPSKESRVAHT